MDTVAPSASCDSSPGSEAAPYLLAWKLVGRTVLVVGGGSIGAGKVETLLGTGARIVVVDPMPSSRIVELAADDRLSLKRRSFRPTDVRGTCLVVAATGIPEVNRRVRRWAKAARAVVNVVDDPALCDVTVPSVVRRGPATIAVTTKGATPAGARFLREHVAECVPPGVGELLEHAAAARQELRRTGEYRYDYAAWRQQFFEPGLDAVNDDRLQALPELQRRFLAGFSSSTEPLRVGRVTLVGAGPGGPDLITVRGARALARADVVLYDRLADRALLDLAPVVAVRIPVGKGKGFGVSQEEIGALLVEHASAGNHVVRLKGGDPFVFGRGSEEIEVVREAGIPVEVVPGISSALAAPALAGIPVTDRRDAAGFTVISGHRANEDEYRWESLATGGTTLVVLMASSTAATVARRLTDCGAVPGLAVAFVHAAGTSGQKTSQTTLFDAAKDGCPFPAPTVMVVGTVVSRILGSDEAPVSWLEGEGLASLHGRTDTGNLRAPSDHSPAAA